MRRLGMVVTALGLATARMAAAQASPDWAGTWKGSLVNLPARPGATPVDVTLEIGALPTTDGACGTWRTTYVEAGVTKGVKDYRLCRGTGPDDLFVDEGDGVRLTARWIGDVLVSPFKYDQILLVSAIRLRGDQLEEEILTVADQPAVGGVLPLTPKGIQRMTFHRVNPAPDAGPDWPGLRRYREANAALPAPSAADRRVVFMGDSITEAWAELFGALFPGRPYIGRGISGQTTPQMVLRFRQDVIALRPRVVVILAGTNDIAGNTGPSTLEMIEDHIATMAEMARANGIRVVLASVLPVFDYPWKRGLEPAPKIAALNAWIRRYAAAHGAVYVDFHGAMTDARGGLPPSLAADGVHPTEAGYRVMAPLVEAAIRQALR